MVTVKGTFELSVIDEDLLSKHVGNPPKMKAVTPSGIGYEAMLTSVEHEIGGDGVILEFDVRIPKLEDET